MDQSLGFTTPADQPSISYRRLFKAEPELVFAAWTRPEHLRRWWGPRMFELVVCEVDLRVGGRYRFVLRSPDGQEYTCAGEYREIEAPHRLVTTVTLDPRPENESIETVTFAAVEGGTLVRATSVHGSIAARDAQSQDGMMESGLTDHYLRLDDLLPSLPPG
ncbi:MAG TPA: SRPBCC family protein [Candidatus Dormibacteraeota bacterium]|nr:SRPBCC family protein [Candidatus Dormibacteraeota bacterium]